MTWCDTSHGAIASFCNHRHPHMLPGALRDLKGRVEMGQSTCLTHCCVMSVLQLLAEIAHLRTVLGMGRGGNQVSGHAAPA